MLATMGFIIAEFLGMFLGYLTPSAGLEFEDIPNGLGAISKVPSAGCAPIVAYRAFCEVSQDQSAGTAAVSGDFGWKVLPSSDVGSCSSAIGGIGGGGIGGGSNKHRSSK